MSQQQQGGGGLRDRVAAQREKTDQQQGGQEQPQHPTTLVKHLLDDLSPEIAKALPLHMNAERMGRILYTQMRNIPELGECTAPSLAGAILTCAQMGMEPGPTGEAWILPFWNNQHKRREAQFQIGYKGLVKLFWQHPLAHYLDAQIVYKNDHFEHEKGLNPRLEHKPTEGERGDIRCWYAVARLANGGYAFSVLYRADVEARRQRSKTPNSPAWKNDYNQMAKKSCLKDMFPYLPKSSEVARALAQDGTVRTELNVGLEDLEPVYPDAVPGDVVHDEGDKGFPNDPGDRGFWGANGEGSDG